MSPLISRWHPPSPSPSLCPIRQNSQEPQVPAVITQTKSVTGIKAPSGSRLGGGDRPAALAPPPSGTARAFLHLPSSINLNFYQGFCRFSAFSSLVLQFSILTPLRAFALFILSLFGSPPLITTQFQFCFLIYIFTGSFLTFPLSLIAISNALCSFSLSPV